MSKVYRVVRHGNVAAVTIPKPVLLHCGLQLGDLVICEVTEARQIVYRGVTPDDLVPQRLRPFLRSEPVLVNP